MSRSIHPFAIAAGALALAFSGAAAAQSKKPIKLDLVYGGSADTFVFIHGHGNCSNPPVKVNCGTSQTCTINLRGQRVCSGGATGVCLTGGFKYDTKCGDTPGGYWTNHSADGGDGHNLMDEATAKCTSGTQGNCTAWTRGEAFVVRYDLVNQPLWDAASDVASCLQDLVWGTNYSTCNPNKYKRTKFKLVTHSMGAAVVDRIMSLSTPQYGQYASLLAAVPYWTSIAGALAGSKAASGLYGTDGAGNLCTTIVSFALGGEKDAGAYTGTRGVVLGEANNGKAGKSPRWVYKVTTTGGGGSCNNNSQDAISEHSDDLAMGTVCGCVGTSSDDGSDGVNWMYDTDPSADPGRYGGKYRSQYTGYYHHWIASWANHSHNRNDAYVSKYGRQGTNGCSYISPGTCIGQYQAVDNYAGTSGNWSACRGSGQYVCVEKVDSATYPRYWTNHPSCTKNTTCGGRYYACNALCPPPSDIDR